MPHFALPLCVYVWPGLQELSPLYVSWAKVFAQVDDEDLLAQATEAFNRQSPEARMGTDVTTIHMDMRRRAVVTYLLIRYAMFFSITTKTHKT